MGLVYSDGQETNMLCSPSASPVKVRWTVLVMESWVTTDAWKCTDLKWVQGGDEMHYVVQGGGFQGSIRENAGGKKMYLGTTWAKDEEGLPLLAG